jgi:septal ring factor EnvC (AmiA/AmiB activator)
MSKEENTEVVETTKDNDSVISNKELEAIEREVLAKDNASKESLRKEVEAQLRKEMETENKLKALELENKKLEEAVKAQAEEKKRLQEEKEKEAEELKSRIGASKAIVNTNSPFQNPQVPRKSNFGEGLSDEQLAEVDEESKRAFLDAHGLQNDQWGGK